MSGTTMRTTHTILLAGMIAGLALVSPRPAGATNGMNLEGYGPIAAGSGGASMAYDNGLAAVMNNPATLALNDHQGQRLDLALGFLGPNVDAATMGMNASSSADAFYMPAFGWARTSGATTFGVAAFAQGGMGTEYGPDSWMADPSMGANTALTQGLTNRSEVSVGRLMFPLAWQKDERLTLGATFDIVWAGLDLQMALDKASFENMANPAQQTIGTASGTLVDGFGALYVPFGGSGTPSPSAPTINTLYHAYFDFSNNNDFTGQAMGYGYAAKLGLTYRISPALTVGATYHSKTRLGDLDTDSATLSMGVNADFGGGAMDAIIPVTGSISVRDFQWPTTLGAGLAWTPDDKWRLLADLRQLQWSGVMKDFTMRFTADNSAANGPFAGAAMDASLYQNWDDQLILQTGVAYAYSDRLTLRGGINVADNPIPDSFVNALFPATVEQHFMAGVGYALDEAQAVNFALTYAPETAVTNGGGIDISHSQLNWQAMYTYEY